jgi:hypothetical protein
MPMTPGDALMLAIQVAIFASGIALLSHGFFAVLQRWVGKEFGLRSHVPGILGIALMLFAVVSAASLGWAYALATVLAGFGVAYLYVYILRWRVEAGLVGPVLAVLSMVLPLADR